MGARGGRERRGIEKPWRAVTSAEAVPGVANVARITLACGHYLYRPTLPGDRLDTPPPCARYRCQDCGRQLLLEAAAVATAARTR